MSTLRLTNRKADLVDKMGGTRDLSQRPLGAIEAFSNCAVPSWPLLRTTCVSLTLTLDAFLSTSERKV